ncbi:MAG: hypothetical protein DRQ40_07285 [Gammaproteobacteria bacterium]|nr:MAG: hypothetical protein DRQ40_07285 [Gammaproteobacteria bacterium]
MSERIGNLCAAAMLLNEIQGGQGFNETLLSMIAHCVDTLQGVVKTCGDDHVKLVKRLGLVVGVDDETTEEEITQLQSEIEEAVISLRRRLGQLEPLATLFWTYDEEMNAG